MSIEDQQQLIEMLKRERDALLSKVKSIAETIEILEQPMLRTSIKEKVYTSEDNSTTSISDGYNPKASLKEKIFFFLKREQRFLHSRELAEMAHEKEPGVDVKTFMAKFSAILSLLRKKGKLVKHKADHQNQNTFWGAPNWIDENGKIIDKYTYNDKYVKQIGDSDQFEL